MTLKSLSEGPRQNPQVGVDLGKGLVLIVNKSNEAREFGLPFYQSVPMTNSKYLSPCVSYGLERLLFQNNGGDFIHSR